MFEDIVNVTDNKKTAKGLEITKQVIIFAEKNKNSGGRYECRAPAPGLGRKNLVLYGVMC
jgi:hypothetical protein